MQLFAMLAALAAALVAVNAQAAPLPSTTPEAAGFAAPSITRPGESGGGWLRYFSG